MSLSYTTYVDQLANLIVIPATDANFLTFLPGCIDYAEQRIYRELQLLDTEVRDTGNIGANTRSFTLPSNFGRFVVLHGMNVFTSGTAVRSQMVPTSRNFIDFLFPSENSATSPSVPQYFANITDQEVIVGPPADQVYTLEVIGTIRPSPLSAANTTTYLTLYLPDLFMAASLVFAFGYQRDFGAQSDDPKSAASWEDQYTKLRDSANIEELKKRYNLTYGGQVPQ